MTDNAHPFARCGRIDDHAAPHDWTRPMVLRDGRLLLPKTYTCLGTPAVTASERVTACR